MLRNAPDLGASGILGQIRCPVFTCFNVQAASSKTTQLASGDSPVRNLQSLVLVGITIGSVEEQSVQDGRDDTTAGTTLGTVEQTNLDVGC